MPGLALLRTINQNDGFIIVSLMVVVESVIYFNSSKIGKFGFIKNGFLVSFTSKEFNRHYFINWHYKRARKIH